MAGTALTLAQAAKELGATLLEDKGAKRHRMQIRSESRPVNYIVAWDANDRQWGCSCPGWANARNGHLNRSCKHIKAMKPTLERVVAPRALGR